MGLADASGIITTLHEADLPDLKDGMESLEHNLEQAGLCIYIFYDNVEK